MENDRLDGLGWFVAIKIFLLNSSGSLIKTLLYKVPIFKPQGYR